MVRIREVIYPARCIGIDINDVTVQKIPFAGERTRNRTIHNTTVIINVSRILRNHNHLIRIGRNICILIAFRRIQTVTALSSLHIVINFIVIVHL